MEKIVEKYLRPLNAWMESPSSNHRRRHYIKNMIVSTLNHSACYKTDGTWENDASVLEDQGVEPLIWDKQSSNLVMHMKNTIY